MEFSVKKVYTRGGLGEDLLKGDTEEIERRREDNTKLGHNGNRF